MLTMPLAPLASPDQVGLVWRVGILAADVCVCACMCVARVSLSLSCLCAFAGGAGGAMVVVLPELDASVVLLLEPPVATVLN